MIFTFYFILSSSFLSAVFALLLTANMVRTSLFSRQFLLFESNFIIYSQHMHFPLSCRLREEIKKFTAGIRTHDPWLTAPAYKMSRD